MSAPPILAEDLAFGWPGAPLLFDGLDLTVRRGEVLALSGPCLLYTSDAADE